MPNNFRLTGDYYVSKFGNDSWSGTSPDAPKRTIQAALNLATTGTKSIIIGAGYYAETISKGSSNLTINIYGDGNVIIAASNSSSIFQFVVFGSSQTFTINFYDVTIFGYSGGFSIVCAFASSILTSYTRCKIINNNIYLSNNTVIQFSCTNTTLIGCTFNFSNVNSLSISFSYCILINIATLYPYSSVTNSYVNAFSFINTLSSITAGNFNYNNIQGSIIMNTATAVTTGTYQDIYGRYYNLTLASGGDGSIGNPYGRAETNGKAFSYTNHRILYPTFNANSISSDPKFNSLEDQDFTLQADSPHIGRASDGISNIGGTKYAVARRATSDTFSGSSATVDPSLIFQYNNYIISGSQVTGSITSAPIAVNTATPKVIQKVTYNGLLAFNKDTGSASGSNQNVPDFDTFTSASGNAAANPDRLVYYMRHTTGSSIPVSDAGWDNGGLWTAGQYNVFEWNTKPSIDNLGVGNGSGSFNAAVSPTFIQATYVQMQVKLRNDYLL